MARISQQNWLDEYSLSPKPAAQPQRNSGRVEKLLQLWRSQTECTNNSVEQHTLASYCALNSSIDAKPLSPKPKNNQGQLILPTMNKNSPSNSYVPLSIAATISKTSGLVSPQSNNKSQAQFHIISHKHSSQPNLPQNTSAKKSPSKVASKTKKKKSQVLTHPVCDNKPTSPVFIMPQFTNIMKLKERLLQRREQGKQF